MKKLQKIWRWKKKIRMWKETVQSYRGVCCVTMTLLCDVWTAVETCIVSRVVPRYIRMSPIVSSPSNRLTHNKHRIYNLLNNDSPSTTIDINNKKKWRSLLTNETFTFKKLEIIIDEINVTINICGLSDKIIIIKFKVFK